MKLMRKRYFALSACALLLGMVSHTFALDMKVLNGADVDESVMVEVLSFCNEQLPFTLAYQVIDPCPCMDTATCQDALSALKTENDAAVIGLVSMENSDMHQSINTNRMVALINVKPLISEDSRQTAWRIQRMLMRSVAFLMGITPAPDPNCVTRNYESLDEFDTMGRNFTPPYNPLIQQKAYAMGIPLKPEPENQDRKSDKP